MVLSQRERMILMVAIAAVALLVGDRFIARPISRRLAETKSQKIQLKAELDNALILFEKRRLMERKWKMMVSDGLRSDATAESRVARALNQWSVETGLTLSSVKPNRVASDKGLKELTFSVAGTGSLEAVARFLWQVERAALPLKVKGMQLGESGNGMSLQLQLSTLYLEASKPSSEPKQQGTQDEDLI